MDMHDLATRRTLRPRHGFTLIELMIVVVVVGILASIAFPRFSDVARRAKEAEAGPLMKQILTLQERYRARVGFYATDLSELEGGSLLTESGGYYTFSLDASHPSGLCIRATPNTRGTAAGLNTLSMDATSARYTTGTCS